MFFNALILLTLYQADKIQTLEPLEHSMEINGTTTTTPQCYNNIQPLQNCFYVNEDEWIQNFESTGIPYWYYSVSCYHCNLKTIPIQNLHVERKKYLESITIIGNLENNIIHLDTKIFQNCTNLKRLFASSIQVNDIQTDYFSNLQNIEKITLRNVTLIHSKIPKNIFENFQNLKYLSIYETNLTMISNVYLKYLKNLEKLFLNNNQIELIEANIFSDNLKLEEIDLSYNLIQTIPVGLIKNLINLKSIDLSNNPIHLVDVNDLISNNVKYFFCYNWPCDTWKSYSNTLVKQFKCKNYDQSGNTCIELYLSRESNDNDIQIYEQNITSSFSHINHLPCLKSSLL